MGNALFQMYLGFLLLISTLPVELKSFDPPSSFAASKPKCKAGFKPAKTPINLQPDGKLSCVNTASATAGKKLLTTSGVSGKLCSTCHSMSGPYPVSQMIPLLRAQGFTLKAADVMSAFNLHAAQMLGQTITSKNAKDISNYLQTLK